MLFTSDCTAGPAGGGDAWQAAVTRTYFPLDTDYPDRAAFRGSLRSWSLGIVGVSHMRCDPVRYKRRAQHFLHEQEASLLITIPEAEPVDFLQNERSVRCGVGGFLLERGDAPYEFSHDRPNSLWVLKVPTASVRARIGRAESLSAMRFECRSGIGALFFDMVRASVGRSEEIGATAQAVSGQYLLELLCLALEADERVLSSGHSSVRAAHLRRAEEHIRANLKDPGLDPRAVAEACGISLRYLQDLFQESGQSVNGFLRGCRLDRCREELMLPAHTRTVAEIAYRWGFTDQSQFCKHYRARFNCSPTDTRRSAVQRAADNQWH